MTDVDRTTDMTDGERRLRAELARTLVPPPTPRSLVAAVDAMAAEQIAAPDRAGRQWKETFGTSARGFRFAAGAVAVVAVLAAVGLALLMARSDQRQVGASPAATLPTITQPALPDPKGAARIVSAGGWIDATTAWAMEGDAGVLWMTTDAGQTWSERGAVPDAAPPIFLDAQFGYAPRTVGDADAGHAILVSITTDGGAHWLPFQAGFVAASDGGSYPVAEAHFVDPQHGIVLGTTLAVGSDGSSTDEALACAGWATDDGGGTWAAIPAAPCILGGRWGSPALGTVYTAALGGGIALTTDGGRTWTEGRVPGVADGDRFATAALVPLADGGARLLVHRPPVGGIGGWTLAAVETHDGGATWRDAWAVPETPLYTAMSVLTADHLVAVGEGLTNPGRLSTFDSWDGGRTWTSTTETWLLGGTTSWLDRLHGTLEGGSTTCREAVANCTPTAPNLWLTNDGGRTWHEVPF